MTKLKNSPVARFGVILMLICMGFFFWDVCVDVYEHISTGNPYTGTKFLHTAFELVAVAGLGYGIRTAWMFHRLLAQKAEGQAQTITLLRGSFDKVLERKFGEWALTAAERDVAIFILKGMSSADIANARGVSLGTTKNQITAIFRKIGVSSRNELMSLFMDEFLDEATEQPA